MRVPLLDGHKVLVFLNFNLRKRQLDRIDPPKWFNIIEYLVVLVG